MGQAVVFAVYFDYNRSLFGRAGVSRGKLYPLTVFSTALYKDNRIPILISAGSVLILLMLIRLVVAVFSRPSEKSIVLRVTEYGIIRVSLETLDDLAQKHARSISYVREVKSRVVPVKDSVRIFPPAVAFA